jgi:hypothetical protein
MLVLWTLLTALWQASDLRASFDASRTAVSAARVITEIDAGKIKGDPTALAWSDDGSTLYLRTAEYDRWRNERTQHFVLPTAGSATAATPAAPAWAAGYWMWKSGMFAPGVPEMRLETETQTQLATAVGTVRDAGASQSRADPTQSQMASDMSSAQQVATITVRLKGTVIAQAVNKPVAPGSTWGWAPAPLGGLVFVDGKKHLVLIDRTGRTFEVPGAAEALLPAWSPDGKRIAYLQKKDRKKYVVAVVDVDTR